MNTCATLHLERSTQNDGDFVKVRSLPRLTPTGWANHAGYTHRFSRGVDSANELLDDLGWLAVCFNPSWCFDDLWHNKKAIVESIYKPVVIS
jgi:hypothetical protein